MKNHLSRKILEETPTKVKESAMIVALKQYLAETPREQIDVDWKAVKDKNLSGPTFAEFMETMNVYDRIRIRNRTKPETRFKIQKQMKEIIIDQIIDEAFALYCPQIRSEITDLAKFLIENTGLKDGKPINVLEIGTKFGGTFYIWNSLNRLGKNISIDMSDGGIHGGVSEEDMDKRDLWFCERFPNCHFIRGNSHLEKTKIQFLKSIEFKILNRSKDDKDRIDLLFIDGDHSYEGVKKDFEDYSPFVKKGGIICLHDINDSERHRERNVFVSKFWQEIKDDPRFESFEINAGEDWAGLGICILK